MVQLGGSSGRPKNRLFWSQSMTFTQGFFRAGEVTATALNVYPNPLPIGRERHQYGDGPFARLKMPSLPNFPGVYLWDVDNEIVYVGQSRTPLSRRLGPNGYSSISNYNTFARQKGRTNGGQQTNCRINALANKALSSGQVIAIWYCITSAEEAASVEAQWMATFGMPRWNRRDERSNIRES